MLREFCGGRVVEKVRYLVPYGGFVWEVDEYFGENEGLFTAEIELDGEEVSFSVPRGSARRFPPTAVTATAR